MDPSLRPVRNHFTDPVETKGLAWTANPNHFRGEGARQPSPPLTAPPRYSWSSGWSRISTNAIGAIVALTERFFLISATAPTPRGKRDPGITVLHYTPTLPFVIHFLLFPDLLGHDVPRYAVMHGALHEEAKGLSAVHLTFTTLFGGQATDTACVAATGQVGM